MLRPIVKFDYFGLPIYLIMALTGFLFALVSLSNKQECLNYAPDIKKRVRWSFIIGILAALFCANIANWFLFPKILQYSFAQKISTGGFSFYYGMFGFFGVSSLLLWVQRLDFKFWINRIVPSVLIFHAFGRIGCSLSGCCYGIKMRFFGVYFDFPAREIEALALFILYFVFEKKIKERRFCLYLLCYSVIRFLLEFGRADERGRLFVTWISPAQVTSVMIWFVLGIYLFIIKSINFKKK